MGVSYSDRGELKEAIPHYKKALTINPNYIEARTNLGNIYFRQNKTG